MATSRFDCVRTPIEPNGFPIVQIPTRSQNLGHEKLDTSLVYYGKLDTYRQDELIQGLVRKDLTVEKEQELLTNYHRLSPKKRAAMDEIAAPEW